VSEARTTGLEGLASVERVGSRSDAGSFGRLLSEEGGQLAQAIRMASNPAQNVTQAHDRLRSSFGAPACSVAPWCGPRWRMSPPEPRCGRQGLRWPGQRKALTEEDGADRRGGGLRSQRSGSRAGPRTNT
jgi:hypothetical protein